MQADHIKENNVRMEKNEIRKAISRVKLEDEEEHERNIENKTFRPNTCNRIVDLRLTPQLKGKKEKGSCNIGKQAQYIIDGHPYASRLSYLVHCLQIPQISLLCRSPPPPSSAL